MKYAGAYSVLSEMLSVPEGGASAFTSRLKNLQNKRFPSGVNVGRQRVKYGATEIAGLSIALTLMSGFVPPDIAIALTRESWPKIKVAFERAVDSIAEGRASSVDDEILMFELAAFAGLGMDKPGGRDGDKPITNHARSVSRRDLDDALKETDTVVTVVDISKMVRQVTALVCEHGKLDKAVVLAQFRKLGMP